MNKKQDMKSAIQDVIKSMMDRVMDKVLLIDPFIKEEHRAKKPLYAALVPDEIFKGSHFERRFVTPFGNAWQNLAVIAANAGLGKGISEYMIDGLIKSERLRRITEVLNRLEYPEKGKRKVKPDWDAELSYILDAKGEDIPVSVNCDIYMQRTSSIKDDMPLN